MNLGVFVMLRVSMLFLLAFLWLLQPHRYGRLKSLLILACGFAVTIYPDLVISQHLIVGYSLYANCANVFEILAVIGTAYCFGAHRDDRALFAGLSASTYDLAGIAVGTIIYYYLQCPVSAIALQAAFYIGVLAAIVKGSDASSLPDVMENMSGRKKLCLIPALSYMSIYAASAWPGNIFHDEDSRILAAVMVVLMFAYYFLMVSLLRAQKKSCRLARDNELLETYASSLERRIEQEKKNQEKMAILRHDLRHRESMVLYYLDAGNEEAIRQMMTEAGSRLDETVEKEYCRNSVLNMILSSAAQKAEEKGIAFECTATDWELPLPIRTEFATIILNLLENAQNAASKVPAADKPVIKVDLFRESAQLIVRISNSYTGELHYSEDSCLPVSERGGGHGYGFRSVMAFAEKYGAPIDCHTENGEFIFQIIIPDKK
jgi:hypothetical protein